MTDFELVKNRLDARKNSNPMTVEEANEIFKDTTILVNQSIRSGSYYWFAIMGEDRDFDNVEDAVDGALKYLKSGGY